MASFPGRSPLRNLPKSNLSSCWPTGVRGLACRACWALSRLGSVSVLACTHKSFSKLHDNSSLCERQATVLWLKLPPAGLLRVVAGWVHASTALQRY